MISSKIPTQRKAFPRIKRNFGIWISRILCLQLDIKVWLKINFCFKHSNNSAFNRSKSLQGKMAFSIAFRIIIFVQTPGFFYPIQVKTALIIQNITSLNIPVPCSKLSRTNCKLYTFLGNKNSFSNAFSVTSWKVVITLSAFPDFWSITGTELSKSILMTLGLSYSHNYIS